MVAVNDADPVARHDLNDVRDALVLGLDVPLVRVDARSRESARAGLVALVRHALSRLPG